MHQPWVAPSASSIWCRSRRTRRGCARKNGTAKPVALSGVNQSEESQTYGFRRTPFSSSSSWSRATRDSIAVPSRERPRSLTLQSSSSSSVSSHQLRARDLRAVPLLWDFFLVRWWPSGMGGD